MFCEIYDAHFEHRARAPEIAAILSLYRELTGQGGTVAFEALRSALGPVIGTLLVVAEADPQQGYRFTSVGAGTRTLTDLELEGRVVREIPGEIGPFLDELYRRADRDGRPLLTVHRSVKARHVHLWERLVLPCRALDGTLRIVDFAKPLQYRSELLDAVFEASCDGILGLKALRDADGGVCDAVVLTANRSAATYLGVPLDQVVDARLLTLMPSLRTSGAWDRCREVIERGKTERFEMGRTVNGLDTLFRVAATPLEDGFVMSMSDITDLRYALIEMEVRSEEAERAREDLAAEISARQMVEGELRRIATTDGLTGVLNRRGFEEAVRRETATARRYGYPLSVVAIDIDHFKRINDGHGHAAGDTVLMTVAAMFMEELRRDTDVVGRVGGEEFMVLLPHTPAVGAAALAERLRQHLNNMPIPVEGATLHVTASFGVRQLGPEGDPEPMMIGADDALYQAKRSGRDRVVVSSCEEGEAVVPTQAA